MAISSTSPGIPKIIKINITSGLKGQPITIRNRTTNDVIYDKLEVDAQYVIDVQNFDNNYTSGDVIEVIVTGEKNGSNTVTTVGDAPQIVTISTSSVNDTARGI